MIEILRHGDFLFTSGETSDEKSIQNFLNTPIGRETLGGVHLIDMGRILPADHFRTAKPKIGSNGRNCNTKIFTIFFLVIDVKIMLTT